MDVFTGPIANYSSSFLKYILSNYLIGRWSFNLDGAIERRRWRSPILLPRCKSSTPLVLNEVIDLRSDNVTLPSAEMREVIATTPVGNDQFGEDPTINRLQDQVALLLEKKAALWLPTGTMANQVALRVLTRPGDDVIVWGESHAV